MDAGQIVNTLKETELPIEDIVVYDENTGKMAFLEGQEDMPTKPHLLMLVLNPNITNRLVSVHNMKLKPLVHLIMGIVRP